MKNLSTKLLKSHLYNTVLETCYTCSLHTSSLLSVTIKHFSLKKKERKRKEKQITFKRPTKRSTAFNKNKTLNIPVKESNLSQQTELHDLYDELDPSKKKNKNSFT